MDGVHSGKMTLAGPELEPGISQCQKETPKLYRLSHYFVNMIEKWGLQQNVQWIGMAVLES